MDTELVIWDWNGTLLDDTPLCWQIAEEMLNRRSMRQIGSLEGYRRLFRFPVEAYYRDMGYTFETETYADITREFLELYLSGQPSCPLMKGAEETLEKLRDWGIRQVVLSATEEERLVREITHFGLKGYFTDIAGQQNDYAVSKAARGVEFIKKLGIDPKKALFVGDTDHDLETAAAIGCRCVLIPNGCQHPDKVRSQPCDVLDDISLLPEYVKAL